jgi:PBP1b-binding outer membrane lipoprotein LpoB
MMNMLKIKSIYLVIIACAIILSSCASNRKCDRRKGVRTEMGTM